jgi:hypothetical protein
MRLRARPIERGRRSCSRAAGWARRVRSAAEALFPVVVLGHRGNAVEIPEKGAVPIYSIFSLKLFWLGARWLRAIF